MAASQASRALAAEISLLSRKSLARIVRLAPKTANAYLRLLQRAGHDPEVVVAVERYLLAARRAERHADDATKQLFTAADDILRQRLAGMKAREAELLSRELAHRRLAVLGETAEAEANATRVPRRAPVTTSGDVGAALLQRTFLDRLRTIAALGQAQWTDAQLLLLSGRRKLLHALGGQWADGWEPTFRYLRDNAAKIAARAQDLRTAEAGLEAARKGGSVIAIRAAEREVRRARDSANGYLSKIKGLLGEAYVPRWEAWNVQMDGYLELAGREAKALGRNWEARRVMGELRIDGAEAWDEAILLVNSETGQAKLFLAAQYKVEKHVSALKQVENDVLRETAVASGRLPRLTFAELGASPSTFDLTPMPAGKAAHRFVFNAAGGRVSATAIDGLRAAGIEVNQLNLDVSLAELDQIARTLMDVVADTVK